MQKSKKNECVKVAIRCRPMNTKETKQDAKEIVKVVEERSEIILKDPMKPSDKPIQFAYDYVFGKNSKQEVIYEKCAKPIIDSVIEGYNGTIFAYGQTGTGKTFTMEGVENNLGIIPRTIKNIFEKIQNPEKDTQYLIRTSMLELYNEKIKDSLSQSKTNQYLEIHEDNKKKFYVKGLISKTVQNYKELYDLFEIGKSTRQVRATMKNDYSSRSHSIFSIIIESIRTDEEGENKIKVGKLNLVDLAGSENVKQTKTTGDGQKEGIKINLSLTTLGLVINKLVKSSPHIPYRDSKLTKLLMDSLAGNTKTVMIANTGPSNIDFAETYQTLKYANNAKNIKINPIINQDPKDALILEKTKELELLKKQIELYNKEGKININLFKPDNNDNNNNNLDNNGEDAVEEENEKLNNLNKDKEKILEEKNELEKKLNLKKEKINTEKKNALLLQRKLKELNHDLIGNNQHDEINESLKLAQKKLEEELKKEKESKNEYLEQKKLLIEKKKDRDIYDQMTKNLGDKIAKLNKDIEDKKSKILDIKGNKKKEEEKKRKKILKINEKIKTINEKLEFQNFLINKLVPKNFVKEIENVIYFRNENKELNNIYKEVYSTNNLKKPCITNKKNYEHYYFNPFIKNIKIKLKNKDFPNENEILENINEENIEVLNKNNLDIFYYHDNSNNKLIRIDNDAEEEVDHI